jgi:hypothetical protein
MGASQGTPLGSDADWRRLYVAGALAAVAYVVLVVVPIVLVFTTPVPPTTGGPLLEYIAEHRTVYLIELVCFVGLAVPGLVVFAALAVALRSADVGLAALGGLLGVVSETIALALGSSPQSLHGGLVVLANRYAQTDNAAERASLASSADALIAATNAVSWAGVLTAAAILLLSALMRQAGWGRAIAVLGIVTGALGIVAEALRPMIGAAYAVYGLLLPVWFGLVGWQLLRLTRRSAAPAPGL